MGFLNPFIYRNPSGFQVNPNPNPNPTPNQVCGRQG